MTIVETAVLSAEQKAAILALWNEEYPVSISYNNVSALDDYLGKLADPRHYLLTNEQGTVAGWAFRFVRDDEVWFAIIIHRDVQGQGWGAALLDELKWHNEVLNGWVTDRDNNVKRNGEIYRSPMKFYLANGFTILPEIRLETEQLSAVKISWHRKTES